jgi:hypothetical protein
MISTKGDLKQVMLQKLAADWGPCYADSDVRLYMKVRTSSYRQAGATPGPALPLLSTPAAAINHPARMLP